jgi:hypothetical protein
VLESQGDVHDKVANQSNSELPSSSPTQSSESPHIQIDIQIAYDLRFGHSTYAWKAKEITFPMEPVSCLTKIGVVRNHQKSTGGTELILVLRHYFGSMGRVSCQSPLGIHPRFWP